jgi:hypothetical protein
LEKLKKPTKRDTSKSNRNKTRKNIFSRRSTQEKMQNEIQKTKSMDLRFKISKLQIQRSSKFAYSTHRETESSLFNISAKNHKAFNLSENQPSYNSSYVNMPILKDRKQTLHTSISTQTQIPSHGLKKNKKNVNTHLKYLKSKNSLSYYPETKIKILNKCRSQDNLKNKERIFSHRKPEIKKRQSITSFLSNRSRNQKEDPFFKENKVKKKLIIRNYHSLDKKKKEQIEGILKKYIPNQENIYKIPQSSFTRKNYLNIINN